MIRVPIQISNDIERIEDFQYVDTKSIRLPASRILIGTANTLDDAALYKNSGDLIMDLTFGATNLGLDTGIEAINQWYAVYAVPGANGSYGLRFSVNGPPQSPGGTGPVGFTKYRYLGIIRNGVNAYNITASHLPGDICVFKKDGRTMNFQGFNDTGGGLYPQATRHTGCTIYIANTATNGILFDFDNLASIGFSGTNPAGGMKIPYRKGIFGFDHYLNIATGSGLVILVDALANDRVYKGMALETSSNSFTHYWEMQPSAFSYQQAIRSFQSANANINRGLLLQKFVDPYIIEGGR